MQSFQPTAQNVKRIGRTLYQEDILWLALSGSGIEFLYEGRYLAVRLQGDDHTSAAADLARIAVYIDNARVLDEMISEPSPCHVLIDAETCQKHTVRVLKLSEAPMSIVGICELITDDGASVHPAPAKAHRIEFIGDSITCGYGVDDEDLTHTFSTATEDVTKAYAYLTAEALDADYSMVCYSGYGIYSGYVDESIDTRNETELVPPYYDLIGFSRGTCGGRAITMTQWDFGSYRPELIVLNLGTNDNSYCRGIADREAVFLSRYMEFLKTIRENNPDSRILCVYGLMNNGLTASIEKAIEDYRRMSGDERISFLPLPTQTDDDGYVVDYHPRAATHRKASGIVTDRIRSLMQW